MVRSRFGNLSTDWFASDHNAKLPRFFSRFWDPFCIGIDAFTECWSLDYGLFVPPIAQVLRVIRKMMLDRATGVLIIPCWKSAAFWPILCPDGNFIPSVIDWFDLPTNEEFYCRCKKRQRNVRKCRFKVQNASFKVGF